MKTFYDILKIKQNATDQEIIEAYNKLEKKYKNDSENLKNIQIAKSILINAEARENYDKKLNEIKQNELISNIKKNTLNYNVKKENEKKAQLEIDKKEEENPKIQLEDNEKINNISKNNLEENKKIKTQADIKKEQKKQEKLKNKELRKQEKKKKEIYEEAYAKYLESLGFKVKRRWTFKRIKRVIISIFFIIIICVILWLIPGVRKNLIQLYENNFIIKIFVDIIGSVLKMIYNAISRIVESW